jgi:RimJ/RimL family protein N-acetyltransferase
MTVSRRPHVPPPAVALRPAEAADCERVWVLRNEEGVRLASFDSTEIPWVLHERWFFESLERADRKIYVILVRGRSEGVARLDIVGPEATVSVYLAPEWRGKGAGPIALRKLAVIAFRDLKLRRLIASVKDANRVSLSAFKRAGFTERKRAGGVVTVQKVRAR